MAITVTRQDLARMYPRALPEWLDAMTKLCPMLCEHYKFTRLDWVHFAGQIAAETDGLSLAEMRENMNFRAERLLEVYSYRLGVAIEKDATVRAKGATRAALAQYLAHKPKELADVVYGGREGTPWMQGSRYIGRGPTQITHLNNYRDIQNEIAKQPGGGAFDLVGNPDLLATDAELGVRSAFADWAIKNLSYWACRDDCDTLSDALNTGSVRDNVKPHGLPRRRKETARAKAIWPVALAPVASAIPNGPRVLKRGDAGDDVRALQERLAELSFHNGDKDGDFGEFTERAVVAFQFAHALKPDGIVGTRTREVMAAAAKPETERDNITAETLAARGSTTILGAQSIKSWAKRIFGVNVAYQVDDQMGLGIADAALAQGEKVKTLVTRSTDLFAGIPVPSMHLVAGVVVGGLCVVLWQRGHQIQVARTNDARSGANLKR